MNKEKVCNNCKGNIFTIIYHYSCDDCVHNGAWDDGYGQYVYGEDIDYLGVGRSEAREDGECELGINEDNGCHLYQCHKCGRETNLYLSNS